MAKDSIMIIDYGSGNLRSAAKAFEHAVREHELNLAVHVSASPDDINKAAYVVLPGQGAFGDCMAGLTALDGMLEALEENVNVKGKPFLGICVGMQLLASQGLEHGIHKGLGWIPGKVVRIQPDGDALKIPHMGWNEMSLTPSGKNHVVLRSADSPEHYYFVHSFVVKCEYDQHILGVAHYGGNMAAVVGRDNIIGTQFHPEKSQKAGLNFIADFIRWKP